MHCNNDDGRWQFVSNATRIEAPSIEALPWTFSEFYINFIQKT